MILSPGWRYQPRLKIIFSLGLFTVRQLPGARGFRLVLPTRTKNRHVKYNPSHLSSKLRSNRKQLLILTFPSLLSLSPLSYPHLILSLSSSSSSLAASKLGRAAAAGCTAAVGRRPHPAWRKRPRPARLKQPQQRDGRRRTLMSGKVGLGL